MNEKKYFNLIYLLKVTNLFIEKLIHAFNTVSCTINKQTIKWITTYMHKTHNMTTQHDYLFYSINN